MSFFLHNMDKFSRFLEVGEDLLFTARSQNKGYRIFVVYFLIFIVFFILYPMMQYGRQGFWLWLFCLVFLLIALARQLAAVHDTCLLTGERLIFLQAISKDYYKKLAYLPLDEIKKVVLKNKNTIYIYTKQRKVILKTKEAGKFFEQIRVHINLP